MNLDALLQDIVQKNEGLSDIHFKVGRSPMVRRSSELHETEYGALTKELTEGIAKSLLPPKLLEHFEKGNAVDTSHVIEGVCRFRVNCFRQRGTVALVMRYIPPGIPSLDELSLPPVLKEISLYERGMVLCTGSAGCGKSTTLAAMIQYANEREPVHIITIEEPIEFEYIDVKASVNQVEVGTDTPSFARSLRASLREDPDIILIGEMRDEETIDTGIKAAETGHLVFSTLHTTDATKTVNRIIGTFAPQQQQQVRYQLAANLKAVVSQRLVNRADGDGRFPATEVMIVTNIIGAYIIDEERTSGIPDIMAKSREQYQMQTVDQHLTDLFREGKITMEVALEAATNRADFERAMNFE
jgi:twitching motility protein PilT